MANKDNPLRGAEFEIAVQSFFAKQELRLQRRFPVELGVNQHKATHFFDLGSDNPPILVECKCHCWTEGGNSPSAKMSVWNEAMYYFSLAPPNFRKIFVVLKSLRANSSLANHYISRFGHLIPRGVEMWQYDILSTTGAVIFSAR